MNSRKEIRKRIEIAHWNIVDLVTCRMTRPERCDKDGRVSPSKEGEKEWRSIRIFK